MDAYPEIGGGGLARVGTSLLPHLVRNRLNPDGFDLGYLHRVLLSTQLPESLKLARARFCAGSADTSGWELSLTPGRWLPRCAPPDLHNQMERRDAGH